MTDSSLLDVLRLLHASPGVAAKAGLTRHFLARKAEEYDALRLEIERLRGESEGQVDQAGNGRA